jgi:tRNA modification GTPase
MLTDVIAAPATPAGRSAIALIRLSGRGAFDVAGVVLEPFRVEPVRTARRARVRAPIGGELLDDALYLTFPEPASYTGQDLVEISTHGGLLVPVDVLAALLAAGAREAAPGEFTRRAVMNGKLDLLQAEAVADLIDATAPAQRQAALGQLDRGLSHRISALRGDVLELEALISYEIDFPEEDSGPVPPERIEEASHALQSRLEGLLDTATEGVRLREGAVVVVAGRPNTGKSSLFNALLGQERAIVTEVAGTTRDAIEAPATCEGFPFRLIDTAGLRESNDPVERIGIEVSRRYLAGADVVLFCAEAGRPLSSEERGFLDGLTAPAVIVRTKVDVAAESPAPDGDVAVSAVTGRGLRLLRRTLAEFAFSALARGGNLGPVVTRERHRIALGRALDEVVRFQETRARGVEGAVAATHLRAAVSALEDLIGVVTADDVLDRVYSTFCVGK